MREALLAVLLVTACALVVRGVAFWSTPAAWIAGGVLVAGLAYLFLAETT